MTSALPISCFIATLNEADRIAITIASVRNFVDEIIVIDSGSTDNTASFCEALGARVIYNKWPGYGFQKRFAEEQCKHHWLLNIDADEEITPELEAEIRAQFACGEPKAAAFKFRIRDLLPGEKKLAPLAHTDFRIRLYDFRRGRIEESITYDPVVVREGETVLLNAPMLHRSFRSLSHMLAKINSFTTVQAEGLLVRGLPFAHARLFIEIPMAFFKCYILRAYVLRGWRGFIFSVVYALGRFVRIAKYIELKQKG